MIQYNIYTNNSWTFYGFNQFIFFVPYFNSVVVTTTYYPFTVWAKLNRYDIISVAYNFRWKFYLQFNYLGLFLLVHNSAYSKP